MVETSTWDKIESEQGLFLDILSRLPVQSIMFLKTVNKYWYASLTNTYFATKHLAKSKEKPTFIVCPKMDSRMNLYSMKPESFQLYNLNTIDPPKRCKSEYMYMISSFNGLICCINHISEEDQENLFCNIQIWICNPSTRETLLLPQGTPSFNFESSVGVAYSSDVSYYKVFRIFRTVKKLHECEVYSSRTGVWKNIGQVPCVPMYSHCSPFRSGHVFVGGKIYWLSSLDDPDEILSVDLEGNFKVIHLPKFEDDLKEEDSITEGSYLVNLRGSLTMVVLHPEYMDIWVWKEEKVEWVFLLEDSVPFGDLDMVLAMTSLKNKILCVTETHWCCYDVYTGIWKKKRANSGGFVNPAMFPFTASVLPCKGSVML